MTFDDYTKLVDTTVQYHGTPQERLSYVSIALAGEVGEYCNELKKVFRHGNMPNIEQTTRMVYELGDVLWYLTRAAHELGTDLKTVASLNVSKLQQRYSRNTDE